MESAVLSETTTVLMKIDNESLFFTQLMEIETRQAG